MLSLILNNDRLDNWAHLLLAFASDLISHFKINSQNDPVGRKEYRFDA
jgi:hypothetical protein